MRRLVQVSFASKTTSLTIVGASSEMTWKTHLFSFRSKVEPDDGGYEGLYGGNDSSHEMIHTSGGARQI